jgi:hypothetical protein
MRAVPRIRRCIEARNPLFLVQTAGAPQASVRPSAHQAVRFAGDPCMTEPEEQGAAAAAVANNLEAVRQRITQVALAAGRAPDAVRLIAVSKAQPLARVEAALAAGQRVFGENYLQPAKARWPALRPAWPGIELHLIGPLQTNKIKEAVALFDVIQTVDRPKLAVGLAAEMARQGRRPACLIQVNTGEEPQKAGIWPGMLADFVRLCRAELGLPVAGLMAIPPFDEPPAPHFALLAKLAARHGLAELSMGMSDDFESAIRFGATQVRVGTAIFGAREARPPLSPAPALHKH